MDYQIDDLTADDAEIVWQALMYAAREESIDAVKSQPYLACYASNWGRSGDFGCVARAGETWLGSAWLRLWQGEERGFGYVSDRIPELGLAVSPDYRGRGIGSTLLTTALARAKERDFTAVSLSVRGDNPVLRLYERSGFVKLPTTEHVNRAGSSSFTMLCEFERL